MTHDDLPLAQGVLAHQEEVFMVENGLDVDSILLAEVLVLS